MLGKQPQLVLFMLALLVVGALGGGNASVSPTLQRTASASAVTVMMNLPEKKADGAPIPVGAIFDLSGPTAEVSKPYAEGVLAYIDWLNNHGGINGRPIKISSADYAYNVDQAQQLYTQFTTQDKVVVFMGWGTGDTEALRTRVAADKIPFISASYATALNDPNGQAPYNFLVGATYSDQALILLQYMLSAYTEDTDPKVAILHSDSPFGVSPLAAAENFLKGNGIKTLLVPMPSGGSDYTPQIAQVKQFGATHVMFQNTTAPAAAFVKQAAEQGLKVVYGCLNWCADEIMISQAKDKAEGMYGAIPFAPPTVDTPGVALVRQYAQAKGIDLDAKGLHYIQGWWSMAVMAEGIKATLEAGKELTGPNIKGALESLSRFDTGGVTPPITFTPSDHRGSKAMRIYQVKNGKWIAITDYVPLPGAR